MEELPAVVKWGKQSYKLSVQPGGPAGPLKDQICALTGVLPADQKLMCKGGWKGALTGDALPAGLQLPKAKPELPLVLIGSASVDAAELAPVEAPQFVEDLSPEDLAAAEAAQEVEDLAGAQGMVLPVQLPPAMREDNKHITYRYNFFAVGLPQRRIESLLERQGESGRLTGELAMSLGAELAPAMVRAICCLKDGSLVSGLANGMLQCWAYARRQWEAQHSEGPVCQLVVPEAAESAGFDFAAAGGGLVKLWTSDGQCVAGVQAPQLCTPSAIAILGSSSPTLVASFEQAQPFDESAFRLVPQDEAQRQRRAEAEAQRERQRDHVARVVSQVWPWQTRASASWGPPFAPSPIAGGPLTGLIMLAEQEGPVGLLATDALGILCSWRLTGAGHWEPRSAVQLQSREGAAVTPIRLASLCSARPATCAVSVVTRAEHGSFSAGPQVLQLPLGPHGGVAVLDLAAGAVMAVLAGHKDLVSTLCVLPDCSLLTGGSKNDATVRLWGQNQWQDGQEGRPEENEQLQEQAIEPQAELAGVRLLQHSVGRFEELGYVYDLCSVPDTKQDSRLFAIAGARYNLVRICL